MFEVGDKVRISKTPTRNDRWYQNESMLDFWERYDLGRHLGEEHEILEIYPANRNFVMLDITEDMADRHPDLISNDFYLPIHSLEKIDV